MIAPQEMTKRLLVNAKWQTHPAPTGVHRYASGLVGAMKHAGLTFELSAPPTTNRWRATLWEQRTLPVIARGFETLLCPANMAPLNLDDSVRLMLTVHCLRFRFHPENYAPSFNRWYNFAIPRLIERADTIFTVSQSQMAEIEQVYPETIGKIAVMPPGVDPSFRPEHSRDSEAPTEPYVVYIGSAAPAKNLRTLLNAFDRMKEPPKLVLIGVDRAQADLICPATLHGRIVPLGHIGNPDRIASLLTHALAMLSPSLYESFGLPCLEAMACGCPVVASDLAAHREVCQGAAVYVEAEDSAGWAEKIAGVVNDPQLRSRMSKDGLRRSRAFDWSKSVSTLINALQRSDKALA